jgi:hypothetical protein
MRADQAPAGAERALSEVLADVAGDTSRERVSISDLLSALRDRAAAALLLIFALPNLVPMPPGTSILLGAPLLFLAAQLAVGRKPWLPEFIARRSMQRGQFAVLIGRTAPWLARAQRLMRPRLALLARPPVEYAVGAVCLGMALIVFLPIPLGNMLPALAICMLALGVLERDGIWVIGGLGAAALSLALVWGVVYAAIESATFMLLRAFG